jgi:hypothetical protein
MKKLKTLFLFLLGTVGIAAANAAPIIAAAKSTGCCPLCRGH